jgi:hypothetical protein
LSVLPIFLIIQMVQISTTPLKPAYCSSILSEGVDQL